MSLIDPSHFPFLHSLEEHWQEIRAEYEAMASSSLPWEEPIYEGKWDVIGFRFQNQDLFENQKRAPITTALCDEIPGIYSYGFSIMQPGCEIKPHVGYTNLVLRGHLGLKVNIDAALQVGEEIHPWQEGKAFVFDDTLLHAAWNRGTTTRAILLFDFYRPSSLPRS